MFRWKNRAIYIYIFVTFHFFLALFSYHQYCHFTAINLGIRSVLVSRGGAARLHRCRGPRYRHTRRGLDRAVWPSPRPELLRTPRGADGEGRQEGWVGFPIVYRRFFAIRVAFSSGLFFCPYFFVLFPVGRFFCDSYFCVFFVFSRPVFFPGGVFFAVALFFMVAFYCLIHAVCTVKMHHDFFFWGWFGYLTP